MVLLVRRKKAIQEMAAKSPNLKQARVSKAWDVEMDKCLCLHNTPILALSLLLHKDIPTGIHAEGVFT